MRLQLPSLGYFLLTRGKLSLVLRELIRARRHPDGWPYQRLLPDAAHSLLIAGDSTAFGTGASVPTHSIAGLFAQAYPHVSLSAVGINGLYADQLPALLEPLKHERYSMIIILVGGNDVLQFTTTGQMSAAARAAAELVRTMSDRVVFVGQGNLGSSKLWPTWWANRLTRRAKAWHAILTKMTQEYGFLFVDMFFEHHESPWRHEPHRFYSADMFHPSDDGYRTWFDTIVQAIRARGWEFN